MTCSVASCTPPIFARRSRALTRLSISLTPNGFVWCQHVFIAIPDTNCRIFLHTVKPAIPNNLAMEKGLVQLYNEIKKDW